MIIKLKACIVSESELDQCCADYLVRMSSFLCIHLNPLPSKSNNYWCVPFCVQSWGPVVRKCVYIPQRYTASYSISSNSLNVLAIQNPGDWEPSPPPHTPSQQYSTRFIRIAYACKIIPVKTGEGRLLTYIISDWPLLPWLNRMMFLFVPEVCRPKYQVVSSSFTTWQKPVFTIYNMSRPGC